MGAGASAPSMEEILEDMDDPPAPDDIRKSLEKDLRIGVMMRCTEETGEMRLPLSGRYYLVCRGAAGTGRGDLASLGLAERKEPQKDGWERFPGGGGVQLECTYLFQEGTIVRVLTAGMGTEPGAGGGASMVAWREPEEFGWETTVPKPRHFFVKVPPLSVRTVGEPHVTQAEATWGSRFARMPVSIPKHLLPNSTWKTKVPNTARFIRKWKPILVAGGGGGAGQNSAGSDAVLTEEGDTGKGDSGGVGGKEGGAGESRIGKAVFYPAHAGAGLKEGGVSYFDLLKGPNSLEHGGQAFDGGGFGGGGAGGFAGGGGGGYSGGGAGGLSNGTNPYGGGGGGSFVCDEASDVATSCGHQTSGMVYIKLLPDWRDPNCMPKDRIEVIKVDPSLSELVKERYIDMVRRAQPLPGKLRFNPKKGWEQVMDFADRFVDERAEELHQRVGFQRDWQDGNPWHRFTGFRALADSADLSHTKATKFGFRDKEQGFFSTEVLGLQKEEEQKEEEKKRRVSVVSLISSNSDARVGSATAWEISRERLNTPPMEGREYIAEERQVQEEFPGLEQAFLKSIALGQIEQVQKYLDQGLSPNTQTAALGSALHVAVKNSKQEVLELLLAHHADIHKKDNNGRLAIHYAVMNGNARIYKVLAGRYRTMTEMKTSGGNNLLHEAAHGKIDLEIVQDLIETRGISPLALNDQHFTCVDMVSSARKQAIQNKDTYLDRSLQKVEMYLQEAASQKIKELRAKRINLNTRRPYSAKMKYPPPSLDIEDDYRLLTEWLEDAGVYHTHEVARLMLGGRFGYDKLYLQSDEQLLILGVSKIGERNKILEAVYYQGLL